MRKATFVFIFITVVLDVLALGIILPVLPKLLLEFEGGDSVSAAYWTGIFATVWATSQFFMAPVLGALSDRFGRRPVILLSNLGLGLDYFLMAWAPTIFWLLLGRVFSGMTSAAYATANAYVADTTAPEKRAASFGMLGAAFGLGFIIGPAVGGLLGSIDLRLPFLVAGSLCLLNTLYGYFILPESLPKEKRSAFQIKKANPFGSLTLLRSKPIIVTLAAALGVSYFSHESLPSVFVLYTDFRYGWDSKTIGLVLMLVGIFSVLVQGGLIGWIIKRIGEPKAMILGYMSGIVGFFIYGAGTVGWHFLVGVPFTAFWGLAAAAITSILTTQVSESQQGQLQGALASLRSLIGIVSPLFFTTVFAKAIEKGNPMYWSGAPYLVASLVLTIPLFVSIKFLLSGSYGPGTNGPLKDKAAT